MTRAARMLGLLALACLASCANAPTEIVLVVDTDYVVPAELDRVEVNIDGPSGSHSIASATLSGAGSVTLPLSLGMSPADGVTTVVVTAVGNLGGREVARRFVRANFVEGERRLLYLTLLRRCGGVTCAAGQTCGENGCSDGVSGPLPPWTGTLPARLDASAPTDAAAEDAPTDAVAMDVPLDQGPTRVDVLPEAAVDAPDDARADVVDASDASDGSDVPDGTDATDSGRTDVTVTPDGGGCPAGRADCDRVASNGCEVDTASDALNCGGCARACSGRPNSVAVCVAGACMTVCATGFGDCNTMAADGCEASLRTTANCGTCGSTCAPRANATATCATGTCAYACATGFGDCDGDVANGCEVDLRTSLASCGMCGRSCRPANGTGRCAAGVCTITCNDGFADCDGNASNGCEANLRSAGTCGSCTASCPTPRPNMVATCAMLVCDSACATGFGDCDGEPTNGCETNLQTAVRNCGACGTVCPNNPASTPGCASGRCINVCRTGTGDCDGNLANGCERNVSNDASNCGACGRECAVPHAVPGCVMGVCVPESCDMGFGNCDGMAANGCETNTNTSATNCGTCGNACPAGQTCTSGRCA